MNLEYISKISMEVIAYAGMAKSSYMEALEAYKKKKIEDGNQLLKQGDEQALFAHKSHAQLLTREMKEQEPQASLLLIHAEDQLMHAETIRILTEELRQVYNSGGQDDGE